MAAQTPEREFASALRRLVADAVRRRGKLKKEVARECRITPDRLSHLEAGRRRPKREEVLHISRGLRLDEEATNQLLQAAGFPPPAGGSGGGPDADVLDRLGPVEQAVAQAEMERDLALVRKAWHHHVESHTRNQERDWADASRRQQEGMDLYWQLRAMTARFLGQVHLAASTADPHLNRVAEAEASCEEGLEAVALARSQPFEVMLLVRLASIKRLRSDYEAAGELYERALAVLDAGAAEGGHRASPGAHDAWRAHWRARIRRTQGVLELFQGHPMRALGKLEASRAHFERTEALEELAQVYYGLGWAHGLRGDLDAALSWDRRGFEYTQLAIQARGRQDERSLLQGHLYLGGHYLDLSDLVNAREHLEEAHALARQPRLSQYHEVGRVHVLLGELATEEGKPDLARQHLQAALDFFTGQQEQALLAAAHNSMGDFHLRQGGLDLHRALDHYARALGAARRCRPPNSYYECAALLNICRARVRGGLPAVELAARPEQSQSREAGSDVETMIGQARELSRTHHYQNHRAGLALLEARVAQRRGDDLAALQAASTALHTANNFSVRLHNEVSAELRSLGLPHRLADLPAAELG